ncbi:MAG TPA: diacylglycerol kinase family protein [Candidatus Kryptonia bacterium]
MTDHIAQLKRETVKFIVNPVSGNGRTRRILPRLISAAEKFGFKFDVQITKAPEHATELARDPANEFDVVVAVGGDGTVNEVAAGVAKSERVMGVIPTGSGNDFAHAIGRLKSLQDYIHRIVAGKIKSIDVGNLRMEGKDFFFVNSVGVGFDAEVARESLRVHRIRGIAKYLLALVKTLSKYKSAQMKIDVDGRSINLKTFLVAIGNGTSAGGGFMLTPEAVLDDGLFDACIVSDVSIPRVLRVLPSVLNGTQAKHPEVTMLRSSSIKIESESPVSIHRDGEIPPNRVDKLEVRVIPKGLNILVD